MRESIAVLFAFSDFNAPVHRNCTASRMEKIRRNIVPILEKHDDDLALGAHSHGCEHSVLMRGQYDLSSSFVRLNLASAGMIALIAKRTRARSLVFNKRDRCSM
jgi:hypothetical protein